MKRLLVFFASLLSIASLQAMHTDEPQQTLQVQTHYSDLRDAAAILQRHAESNDRQTVHEILHPTEWQIRAGILDAQLKQNQDKNIVNDSDPLGNTRLMQEIAGNCNAAIIETLLVNNADPRLQNKKEENALHILLDRNHSEVSSSWNNKAEEIKFKNNSIALSLLLRHARVRDYINTPDYNKNTPLLRALYNRCPAEVIEKLIQAGADIYQKAKDGSSVIHITGARYGHERKNLIDTFAMLDREIKGDKVPLIDQPNNDSNTPLMDAVTSKFNYANDQCTTADAALVDNLLAHKPNIYATNKYGEAALHKLLESHVLWLSLEKYSYNYEEHLLEKKLIQEKHEILKKLLAQDSQRTLVNTVTNYQLTPLMIAQRMPSIALYHEGKRQRPRIFDGDIEPASSIVETIRILIAHGADVTAKNNYAGQTFINYLLTNSEWLYPVIDEIIEAIPEHQRQYVINEPDKQGNSPVINAIGQFWFPNSARNEAYFPLKALLRHKADVNTQNRNGQPALEIAYTSRIKAGLPCHSDIFADMLWHHNPKNKWSIYKKCRPLFFYSAAGTIVLGTGIVGCAALSAYSYLFGQPAIPADVAKVE